MSLEKTEAVQTCESISFLDGWRACVVDKIAHVFLSNWHVVDDGFSMLVDRDDDNNEAVNMQFLVTWVLISRYAASDF